MGCGLDSSAFPDCPSWGMPPAAYWGRTHCLAVGHSSRRATSCFFPGRYCSRRERQRPSPARPAWTTLGTPYPVSSIRECNAGLASVAVQRPRAGRIVSLISATGGDHSQTNHQGQEQPRWQLAKRVCTPFSAKTRGSHKGDEREVKQGISGSLGNDLPRAGHAPRLRNVRKTTSRFGCSNGP